ncbi:H-NS family nucleoid-associated regulatory protein [Burkholderia sp. MSMB1835]
MASGERAPVAPKYRDPKSGKTRGGRGKTPQWIASAKNRDRFLIEQ